MQKRNKQKFYVSMSFSVIYRLLKMFPLRQFHFQNWWVFGLSLLLFIVCLRQYLHKDGDISKKANKQVVTRDSKDSIPTLIVCAFLERNIIHFLWVFVCVLCLLCEEACSGCKKLSIN